MVSKRYKIGKRTMQGPTCFLSNPNYTARKFDSYTTEFKCEGWFPLRFDHGFKRRASLKWGIRWGSVFDVTMICLVCGHVTTKRVAHKGAMPMCRACSLAAIKLRKKDARLAYNPMDESWWNPSLEVIGLSNLENGKEATRVKVRCFKCGYERESDLHSFRRWNGNCRGCYDIKLKRTREEKLAKKLPPAEALALNAFNSSHSAYAKALESVGDVIGNFTVLSVDRGMTTSQSIKPKRYCDALCSCGNIDRIELGRVKNRKWCGKCQDAENDRQKNLGCGSNTRKGKKETAWANKVKASGACCMCGSNEDLNAHHLDGYNAFPDSRYDVDNGVCICHDCHRIFHHDYGFGNNTKEQFMEYLAKERI